MGIGLITREMKVKDISPALDRRVREKYGLTDDTPFIRKGLVPEDLRFDEGERSAVDYITTAAVDRDHEIVDPAGAVIEEFMKHPVVLFGHNHFEMPIGKAAWIRSDAKGLIAKTIYANTAKAKEVYEYRKAGFPLAKSIGFIPLEIKEFAEGTPERGQGARRKYTRWLLLEYSDVPVPSNPEALEIAVSKGLIPAEAVMGEETIGDGGGPEVTDIDLDGEPPAAPVGKTEKPGWDETDEQYRYRVRDPGLFRDDTFRTVPLKKDKPRVNSVMGKLKKNAGKDDDPMVMQNLMFPKSDWDSMDACREWVSAHGDMMKDAPGTEVIEKSGRVLSAKNREIITAAVDAMVMAVSALDDLLAATEPAEPEEEEGKAAARATEPEGYIMRDSEFTPPTLTDVSDMVSRAVDAAITERIIPALKDAAREAVNLRRGRLN